jgi:class 3 adenylate cyclase
MDDLLAALLPFVPADRRPALAQPDAAPLAQHAQGAVLLADLAGFTRLTTQVARARGGPRGAEDITATLDRIFSALIDAVHGYRGSVIGFAGDACIAWFADPDAEPRALAAARAMQQAMPAVGRVSLGDTQTRLSLKVALVSGPVQRWLVGDPAIQVIDVLAGRTLDRLAVAGSLAGSGEIVTDAQIARHWPVATWRDQPAGDEAIAVLTDISGLLPPRTPWPDLALPTGDPTPLRRWLLPTVADRLTHGQAELLAGFRPAAALFLRFDGIAYDRDPEAGQQLDALVRWVQQIVTSFQGALIQLTTGDKGSYLYAAFGAPTATADLIDHALAAAWLLRDAPAQFAFLECVQIGISQGVCYTGAYGSPARRTYGVLGASVNRAAHLMQAARPGQVLLSAQAAQAAGPLDRRWYVVRPLAPLLLKDAAAPVPVAELVPGPPAVTSPLLAPGSDLPLVGRGREQAHLVARLPTATDQAPGGLVLITGEAGVGKSRLLAALHAQATVRRVGWLSGSGQRVTRHRVYSGWQGVLRDLLARAPSAPLPPDLQARLPLLTTILEELRLPATPQSAALEGAARQRALQNLVIMLLRRAAAQQPLLVVLEDAHWFDPLSWHLLQEVTAALVDTPILLVVTSRPLPAGSTAAATQDALCQSSLTSTLPLTTLPEPESTVLAAHQLGVPPTALPAALPAWLYQRSGGHPLLLLETLRALLAARLLTVAGGTVQLTGDLHHAALPATVPTLIQARLDRLPPASQQVARVAAVIGNAVPHAGLQAVLQATHLGGVKTFV